MHCTHFYDEIHVPKNRDGIVVSKIEGMIKYHWGNNSIALILRNTSAISRLTRKAVRPVIRLKNSMTGLMKNGWKKFQTIKSGAMLQERAQQQKMSIMKSLMAIVAFAEEATKIA